MSVCVPLSLVEYDSVLKGFLMSLCDGECERLCVTWWMVELVAVCLSKCVCVCGLLRDSVR